MRNLAEVHWRSDIHHVADAEREDLEQAHFFDYFSAEKADDRCAMWNFAAEQFAHARQHAQVLFVQQTPKVGAVQKNEPRGVHGTVLKS